MCTKMSCKMQYVISGPPPPVEKKIFLITVIQLDQINITVFFWYLAKNGLSVYATIHIYTGQVTFYKILQKQTAMFNWSPCFFSCSGRVG